MHRLALVTSHPIQYQAPWFRALAAVTDLDVFFCHRQDAAGQAAAGFGVAFDWDVPLLDGYRHHWLENRAPHPDPFRFSGCDTPEIGRIVSGGRFDACIVSGWYLKSYIQTIRACRRTGTPLLARGDSQLATSRSALWKTAKYLPYRWLLGSIDAHLFVGEANRQYLAHYGVPESHLFFTPHFVDNEFFRSRADRARADGSARRVRERLGIPPDETTFMFAGKLVEKKRPADLVRALAAARADGIRASVMVVGSGPLQEELERLAASLDAPVRFAGFQNQGDIAQYYAAADAIVLPSDAGETWGLVVNEAMACGLPAIVSDVVGCARDLVEDGLTGYRFPVGDVRALAGALGRFDRASAGERRTIDAAVVTKIEAYTCEAAVRGTLRALDAVTSSARPRRAAVGGRSAPVTSEAN